MRTGKSRRPRLVRAGGQEVPAGTYIDVHHHSIVRDDTPNPEFVCYLFQGIRIRVFPYVRSILRGSALNCPESPFPIERETTCRDHTEETPQRRTGCPKAVKLGAVGIFMTKWLATNDSRSNVVMNWVAMAAGMIVPFFLTPFVIRHLGPVVYGIWILAVSAVSYLNLLDLGLRSAIVRYVSKSTTEGNFDEAPKGDWRGAVVSRDELLPQSPF